MQARALLELANHIFLHQEIEHPTRQNNVLDLLFTNNHELIRAYSVQKTIFSNHNLITATTNKKKNKQITSPEDCLTHLIGDSTSTT